MARLALHAALLGALAALPGCRVLVRDCGTPESTGCHDDELCHQPDPSVAGACLTRCDAARVGGLCEDGRVCAALPAGPACTSGGTARRGEPCDEAIACETGAVCGSDGTCVELCDSRHACSSGTCDLEPLGDRGRCIGP